MVCRNVELEARLIDDMLDLTRITRSKLKLELKPADIHEILQHAIEIVHGDIQDRHISLSLGLEATNRRLLADPARMQQVFWNVLHNSCKFTPEEGEISIRSYNPAPEIITVEIRDSGIGIEPEHLKKIFDAFEQVDSRQAGLGLGLAIAEAIIELHGGTIHAFSEGLGRGATFAINLRLSHVDNLNEGTELSGGVSAECAPEFSGANYSA
jgi:signal transduction histidine kinase